MEYNVSNADRLGEESRRAVLFIFRVKSACFESGGFLSKKHPGFSPLRQKMLWLKKHKTPTESKTRQTRLATKLDIDREKHAML